MPKIIENLEKRLLEEAQKQIEESGYGSMTVRSVAAACGVAVGTVYNYFPSKDDLVAAYMLRDWRACIALIEEVSTHSDSPAPVVHCIYEQLFQYAALHQAILRDEAAASGFAGSFSKYHAVLRSQLAQPLQKFCSSGFTAEFIAEALLTWTMTDKNFEQIYGIISKLF